MEEFYCHLMNSFRLNYLWLRRILRDKHVRALSDSDMSYINCIVPNVIRFALHVLCISPSINRNIKRSAETVQSDGSETS
jgi:hypothetical protein